MAINPLQSRGLCCFKVNVLIFLPNIRHTVISCIILLLYFVDCKTVASKEQYIGLSDDFNRFERHVLSLKCIFSIKEKNLIS